MIRKQKKKHSLRFLELFQFVLGKLEVYVGSVGHGVQWCTLWGQTKHAPHSFSFGFLEHFFWN